MDLVIGLLWLLTFSVIVLFLGALNYFLGRTHSDIGLSKIKSQIDTTNQQQQLNRNSTSNNRRKHVRNANKKQRQLAAATTTTVINENSNSNNDEQETELVSLEIKNEEEEYEDPMNIDEVVTPLHVEDDILPVKQGHKNKSNSTNSKHTSTSSNEESILPLKSQANIVVPAKQSQLSIPKLITESTQISQDNHSKSNGHVSTCDIYSYSKHNPLPPRFQQQRQEINEKKIRQQKSNEKKKQSSNSSISPVRQNHFSQQQQLELPPQFLNQNGYSSESDNLTESSSIAPTLSTESQLSFKRSDLLRSLSSSNLFLDELVSIFDTTSFTSDELELILNKITTKHLLNKQTQQRLILTNKNEKTIERLLDETYRSQAKILTIELQSEKNHVSELTKINAEMEQTIRQLQQPNNNMITYQQTILHYQMQIRRMTDENTRLAHQLHIYSIMPASINELKQQQIILNEQLRQITMRNNHLEKEISDGQQASKQAAEIYQKADNQKQERIETMINDLNKYKKIEKDLNILQDKHIQLEKDLNSKLNDLTHQRDELKKSYDQLNEQIQYYEQLQNKYEQLQEELNTKNDLLKQSKLENNGSIT